MSSLPAQALPDKPSEAETEAMLASLEKSWSEPNRPPRRAEPEKFDLDSPLPPINWLIWWLLARGEVGIVSADTGMGKSLLLAALIAAILRGTDWVGREVRAVRVLVIDEENPLRTILARLKALGIANDQLGNLHYCVSQGIRVGDPGWEEWLSGELSEWKPDLVLIDTIATATAIEDLNDGSVVADGMQKIRRLAVRHDCGVLLAGHHRKGGESGGQALMGSRHLAAQVDLHAVLTWPKYGPPREREEHDTGEVVARTLLDMSVEKLRAGFPPPPERIVIESKTVDEDLVSLEVRSEGSITTADPPSVALETAIIAALEASGPLGASDLARACDVDPGGSLDRLLKKLKKSGRVVQDVPRGPYRLEDGPRI